MISQKIIAEFCVIKGNYSSITLDLLPTTLHRRCLFSTVSFRLREIMADLLQKAIQAMSLEEEEPLVLPDSPNFRVFDENEISFAGTFAEPGLSVYGENDSLHAYCVESLR